MKARILIIAGFFLVLAIGYGQTVDNTIRVGQFPGNDVGTKVANAMKTCTAVTQVPCVLVIEPSLATMNTGTMPTLCSHCYLDDWRNGPPAGGGPPTGRTCPSGLIVNSTAAGATNASILNASLLSGQTDTSGCAPGAYYINGSLTVHSGVKWKSNRGVVFTQNTSGNVINNYAATQSLIPSSGCAAVAGTDTICKLNFPSHGFPSGSSDQWVYAQGAENYIKAGDTATITSLGTLAGCTTGTQNVSLTNGGNITFANVGTVTVSGGVPTGTITFTSTSGSWGLDYSLGLTVATCTGAGTATASASYTTDGAYNGVFQVISVVDSNNVNVQLNRNPGYTGLAPVSGEYWVQHADTGIELDNVATDANGNPGSYRPSDHNVMFAFAHDVQINSLWVTGKNTGSGYAFACYGVDDLHVRNGFYDPGALGIGGVGASGTFQCDGPITNSSLEATTQNMDDLTALDNDSVGSTYGPLQPNYMGGGDLLHDTVSVRGVAGSAHCFVHTTHELKFYYTDALTVENSDCHALAANTSALYAIDAGSFGTITFSNIRASDDRAQPTFSIGGTGGLLQFKNISGPLTPRSNAIQLIEFGAPSIEKVVIDGLDWVVSKSGDTVLSYLGTPAINSIDVSHSIFNDLYPAQASSSFNVASGINDFRLDHNVIGGLASVPTFGNVGWLGQFLAVAASGPKIYATDNYYNGGGGGVSTNSLLSATANTTFYVANNNLAAGWMVGCGGSITCTINDGGGNTTNASIERFIGVATGSPTFTIFNGCSDAFVDIAHTYLAKTNGACVYNFNSGSGTVGAQWANGTSWVAQPTIGASGNTHDVNCLTTPCVGGSTYVSGTTYTNSSGVSVTEEVTMHVTGTCTGYDAGLTTTIASIAGPAAGVYNNCSGDATVSFIVVAGQTFSATAATISGSGGTPTISRWHEVY